MPASIFGSDTEESKAWYDTMRGRLLDDKLDGFFRELETQYQRASSLKLQDAAVKLKQEYGYFKERRHLLRYKECKARGLPIGSGMVEGGIRFVGKDRLCRTGMRWSIKGAELILQLRCLDASRKWNPFLEKQRLKRIEKYKSRKTKWLQAA